MARLPGTHTRTWNDSTCVVFTIRWLNSRAEQGLNAGFVFTELCFQIPVPSIVHRCASVNVRRSRVCTIHHEQLSLQDLPCLGCHMKWGSAFLLWDTHRNTVTNRDAWHKESKLTAQDKMWVSGRFILSWPGGRSWPERRGTGAEDTSLNSPSARLNEVANREGETDR